MPVTTKIEGWVSWVKFRRDSGGIRVGFRRDFGGITGGIPGGIPGEILGGPLRIQDFILVTKVRGNLYTY